VAGPRPTRAAPAVTSDSPEVKQAIARAVKFLEGPTAVDGRLGAQALVALSLLKNGAAPEHPRVVQAVRAIDLDPVPDHELRAGLLLDGLLRPPLQADKNSFALLGDADHIAHGTS